MHSNTSISDALFPPESPIKLIDSVNLLKLLCTENYPLARDATCIEMVTVLSNLIRFLVDTTLDKQLIRVSLEDSEIRYNFVGVKHAVAILYALGFVALEEEIGWLQFQSLNFDTDIMDVFIAHLRALIDVLLLFIPPRHQSQILAINSPLTDTNTGSNTTDNHTSVTTPTPVNATTIGSRYGIPYYGLSEIRSENDTMALFGPFPLVNQAFKEGEASWVVALQQYGEGSQSIGEAWCIGSGKECGDLVGNMLRTAERSFNALW